MKLHSGIMILGGTLLIAGCKDSESQSAPVSGQIKTIEETTEQGQRVVIQVKIGPNGEEIRHGIFTAYHPNGNKWGEEEYKDGVRHGKHLEWWPSGVKKTEGQFADDAQEGTWTMWDKNGNKIHEIEYVAGKPVNPPPTATAPAARPQSAPAPKIPAPTTQPASP